jgi:transposase
MNDKKYKTYVGADLHKSMTYFIAQDRAGKELASRKIANRGDHIRDFLGQLPQPVKTVIESTGNWEWFCEELKAGGYDVMVAHANEVRARSDSRDKSDRKDARLLASLLRGNLIEKESWQAPEPVRQIRERLRYMQMQNRTKTAHKNRIHSILIRLNIKSPRKDAFCKSGRLFLRSLDIGAEYKTSMERSLALIEVIEKDQQEDKEFCERLAREDELVWLLSTIPGVGAQLACMIRYETGDAARFERVEQYVSHTGLVPGKRQSSDSSRDIGITKEGSFWLRWAFVQAAQTADRQTGRLSRFYWKQMRKSGKRGKAIVATAREIAVIAYCIMTRHQGYFEPLALSPHIKRQKNERKTTLPRKRA